MLGLFSRAPGSSRRKPQKAANEAPKKNTSKTKTNTRKKSSRPVKKDGKGRGSSGTQTRSRSNPQTPEKERKRISRATMGHKEKEETAVKDDGGKGSQALQCQSQLAKPKNIEVKNRAVDEANMVRVFEKYKRGEKERSQAQKSIADLDEKSKILIDRVTKKPSKMKLKGEKSELLIDEISTIYPKAPGKKRIEDSVNFEEDSYSTFPRLVNVRKLPPDDIYTDKGVPTWAEYLNPTEEDMVGIDEPIQIGSEHVELFRNKEIKLITIPPTNLTMDPFQPLPDLMKRDEVHFDNRLVFSNTLRSLINIVPTDNTKMDKKKSSKKSREKTEKKIKFDEVPPLQVMYHQNNC
ncbi:hypothetical protein CAEBREN_10672 [Caenorhabditis brenneri]|uniref:Uncharacterized protein n=1 Tax=Caenorhabditis brenneri TaxID=135651 RepID=G0MC96_CAEBE|nr:hypothetical protein CAEBREN_10672 [Caenorhabditis brenneri]